MCSMCEWYCCDMYTLIIVRMTMVNDGIYTIVWLWIAIMRMYDMIVSDGIYIKRVETMRSLCIYRYDEVYYINVRLSWWWVCYNWEWCTDCKNDIE